ncbi:hypothetical protein WJX79_008366 [Trebouxia sp. C0005]
MRGIFRCCCFSPSRTLQSQDSCSLIGQDDLLTSSITKNLQTSVCPTTQAGAQRKSWWSLRSASNGHKDWLLDHDSYTAQEYSSSKHGTAACNKQSAATKADSVQLSSPQIKAQYASEKAPLMIHASSTASEPIAPHPNSSVDVGDGYERTPFRSDVRWCKDRSNRKLSAGGTATVYRGELMHNVPEDNLHDSAAPSSASAAVTHVAVKALNVEQGDNAQLAEREGGVLASLSSKEYVPDFHGYYTDPDTQRWHRRAYILTELLPGMNLDDMCYKVVLRLAQALEDVHKERSHRDIKAGNVMVSGWDSGQELKLHLIDWANSRLHDEEHLLNEYCTPEYSAPQLIAAITCLPAPIMDDAACDLWSLGVVMFQLLVSTVSGPQVPFEPKYDQLGHLVGADRLRGIQTSVQQQQADWAINNPAYNCEAAGTADSCESAQPWQLAAVQTAADFGDSNEEAAERLVAAHLESALWSGETERLCINMWSPSCQFAVLLKVNAAMASMLSNVTLLVSFLAYEDLLLDFAP